MPLKFGKSPTGGENVVAQALSELGSARATIDLTALGPLGGAVAPRPGAGDISEKAIAPAQQVFEFALQDISAGSSIEASKPVGWRYLIAKGGEAVESADVNLGASGDVRFSHVNRGPFVAGASEAIHVAEQYAEEHQLDFELRYLLIPLLFVNSLWLKSEKSSDQDVIIPIAPTFPPLVANRPYSPEEFLKEVRPQVEQRLNFNDAPQDETTGGANEATPTA